jgi:hypothetical protein
MSSDRDDVPYGALQLLLSHAEFRFVFVGEIRRPALVWALALVGREPEAKEDPLYR